MAQDITSKTVLFVGDSHIHRLVIEVKILFCEISNFLQTTLQKYDFIKLNFLISCVTFQTDAHMRGQNLR